MRRTTEDEQPVRFLQASQFVLTQRAGLFEPSVPLFDQPSPAQADDIAGLARGSAIQVAGAAFVVLRHMRCHVQLPHNADEVFRVAGLPGTQLAAQSSGGRSNRPKSRDQNCVVSTDSHLLEPFVHRAKAAGNLRAIDIRRLGACSDLRSGPIELHDLSRG